MSIQLIVVLLVLMVTNQLIGTGYGSWKAGFDKALFFRGVKKILLILAGYGAIALTAHFAADYIPKIEYLSGILLEPIAKYFTKVCDSLKQLLHESARTETAPVKQLEEPRSDIPAKEPSTEEAAVT